MYILQKLTVFIICCIWLYYLVKTTLAARQWSYFTWAFLVIGIVSITTATFVDLVASYYNLYKVWTKPTIKILFTFGAIAYTVGIIGWSKLTIKMIHDLKEQSNRDPLTGLLNRKGITDFYNKCIKNYHNLYIVIADLDGTKEANDLYGHMAGDKLIIGTAQIIKDIFGPHHAAGRLGGDEFISIIPEISLLTLENSILQLRKEISQLDLPITAEISIGFANYPNDGNKLETLLAIADERMYSEKRAKKGNLVKE